MSSNNQPIPVPLSRRVTEARQKIVPLMVFGIVALVTTQLWMDTVTPGMLVGEVISPKSSITSPVTASVERLHVTRLQHVNAGDIVAELRPVDPSRDLDALQSELTLLRTEAGAVESISDAQRSARRDTIDIEHLRLDLMSEKVALVLAEAQTQKASLALDVFKNINDTAPQGARRMSTDAEITKAAADAEVEARRKLITTLEDRLKAIPTVDRDLATDEQKRVSQMIADLDSRLKRLMTEHRTIQIKAPISGVVTSVLKLAGENLVEGEMLITITSTEPDGIVGYLRQPLPIEPAVGQVVEVRTQGKSRIKAQSRVTKVGSHYEVILNPALHPSVTQEVGLPVEIAVPKSLRLRPGELVSLVIKPADASSPSL